MPVQGLNYNIISGGEQHQAYQSTGSFTVYNANDGVAFVATDRTATGQQWDYKIPSQSGGHFPGPINSYLSIYYLDQSGSGAPGQIVVYAHPRQIEIPYFWSIGRAIQSQSTSMDIVQGSQPANPGSGISRLWSNTSGSLHILLPSGQDKVVLDSSNAATYVNPIIDARPLGGDLYGTIASGHVGIKYGDAIQAYDKNGTFLPFFRVSTDDTIIYAIGSGPIDFINSAGNAGSNVSMGPLQVSGYPMNGTWQTCSASVTQSVSCVYTVNYARWTQLGRFIHVQVYITFTGTAGTAGQPIVVTVTSNPPPNPQFVAAYHACGTFVFLDSGIAFYTGAAVMTAINTFQFYANNNTAALGQSPSFPVENSDVLSFEVTYEI